MEQMYFAYQLKLMLISNHNMKQQKDILYILVPSFILLILWIGFTIYSNAVSSTITQTQQVNLQPISPNFDTTTIDKLSQRKQVTPENQAIVVKEEDIETSLTPTQSLTTTPSSGSAEETIIPEEESPIPEGEDL